MYADVDEKTGETLQITKPIPLPALNVRRFLFVGLIFSVFLLYFNGVERLFLNRFVNLKIMHPEIENCVSLLNHFDSKFVEAVFSLITTTRRYIKAMNYYANVIKRISNTSKYKINW